MVSGGAITRSTASTEPHPEVRGAKEASASPRAAPGGGRHDLCGEVGAGRHDLGGASASAVRELPAAAALVSPPCRAAAEVGDALAAAGSIIPATPSPSRPPSQLFAGRLPWETAPQATAVGHGRCRTTGREETGEAERGAHAPPPVAPQSSAPDDRGGQRGGEAARQLPGEWLGPPLPREPHAAHAAAAQHASAAVAEARAIELRAALDAMEAAVISAHGATGAGATLGSSPRAAAAGGAGGGAVGGEAVAHQLARLRRRAALCSELAMRQRLLAHALHTDGGAGGGGGGGGGQGRAVTAEERATAVVQIEAELAAWERLALPHPPPRWAEPPLAQEPTAAAVLLAAAAGAAAGAGAGAAGVAPSAREAAAAAGAAADAAMVSSPARVAPVAIAAASSAGTAAAAAGVISQMRVEQQVQKRRIGGATACFRPPGTLGFGPWLLHAFKRHALAAQTPVGSSYCGCRRFRRSTIQVERQLEQLEARRQNALLLARCHALQAALERSETANHAQRLGQLATPPAAAAAAAARQPLSTARTTEVLAPTSRGGRATYYVDEAEEDAEDAPAAGGASVANGVGGPTSYGPRNGERRRCEMHDRACNGASPGPPPSLLPSRQGSSTYYVDEGDDEEPVRPPVMLSRQGSSTYYVDDGDESEEEPAGSSVVPNRQGFSTYYVDESEEGEEGEEEPPLPPVPAGGSVLSSVSCRLLLYGEPKLVSFEADLSRDTASGLALELVCELGLDEDETTLCEIERQIGVALKAGLADRASLC